MTLHIFVSRGNQFALNLLWSLKLAVFITENTTTFLCQSQWWEVFWCYFYPSEFYRVSRNHLPDHSQLYVCWMGAICLQDKHTDSGEIAIGDFWWHIRKITDRDKVIHRQWSQKPCFMRFFSPDGCLSAGSALCVSIVIYCLFSVVSGKAIVTSSSEPLPFFCLIKNM